jgi:hypothetical protein
MRGGDDHWTVYAINRANEPATITVTGLPASQTWVASTWNAGNGDGDLSWQAPEASTAAGAIQTTLPPRCIKALTTLLSR